MQGKTGADDDGDGMEAEATGGGRGGQGNGGGGRENAVGVELLPLPQVNMVDFDSIHINERATRKVGHFFNCLRSRMRAATITLVLFVKIICCAIGVSHTACKDEFRQNIRSHSRRSVFLFL